MTNRILSSLLPAAVVLGVVLATCSGVAVHAADGPRLRWIVKDGAVVDRARGERLYREACRVIESRFAADGKSVRPEITIHVGTVCPDASVTGACLAPASGELFLPQWDRSAPGSVTQATLVVALLQLRMSRTLRTLIRWRAGLATDRRLSSTNARYSSADGRAHYYIYVSTGRVLSRGVRGNVL